MEKDPGKFQTLFWRVLAYTRYTTTTTVVLQQLYVSIDSSISLSQMSRRRETKGGVDVRLTFVLPAQPATWLYRGEYCRILSHTS